MTESILLKRIADYFRNWNGIEENAPKLEISVAEMREITSMNVERCKLRTELKNCWEQFKISADRQLELEKELQYYKDFDIKGE